MGADFTYQEIMAQPDLWSDTVDHMAKRAGTLSRFVADADPEEVIFTGCGTSHYISIAAALSFQEITGISARAEPASALLLNPRAVIARGRRTLVVASSRSGQTTEVVRAMEALKRDPFVRRIAVTANPASELAAQAQYSIVLDHVRERSIVMTGSFTSILLALQMLACIAAGEADRIPAAGMPEAGSRVLPAAEAAAERLGNDLSRDHFIYLGLGAYFGLACEGMLKMKEMTQAASEAFNPLEFRHGPISVLNERCAAVLLCRAADGAYERDLVRDMERLGTITARVGSDAGDSPTAPDVRVGSDAGDPLRAVLYLPFLQLLAYHRARRLGLDPDKPRHLSSVVVLP